MYHPLDRRSFLKAGAAMGAGFGLAGMGRATAAAERPPAAPDAEKLGWRLSPSRNPLCVDATPHAEKLGWRLGCQAYSFNRFTFFEAVDKTAGLGLHYIEAFPWQKVSKEIKAAMGDGLSAEQRKTVKAKLADSGVKLVNYGVVGIRGRKTFDFAKDMGIETLVAEPAEDKFQELDALCGEYKINIAIHDHTKLAHYWNPDTVLKVTKGLSKRIGACCDTGHWGQSGLNAVECLKKLEGRIISFHFKDLNKLGNDGHDVPWGTGVSDVKGMLAEVHRQGVKAVFSVEYEYLWDNPQKELEEIARSVAYFDKVAAELAEGPAASSGSKS